MDMHLSNVFKCSIFADLISQQAHEKCFQNLHYIERHEEHTIAHAVQTSYKKTKVSNHSAYFEKLIFFRCVRNGLLVYYCITIAELSICRISPGLSLAWPNYDRNESRQNCTNCAESSWL